MTDSRDTDYPVLMTLRFTRDQWARVEDYRLGKGISTKAEALRRLLDTGLKVGRPRGVKRSPA